MNDRVAAIALPSTLDPVDLAVDNDIVIKTIRYGEIERLFPEDDSETRGYLDAARFVVPSALRRAKARSSEELTADSERIFATWRALQPTDDDVAFAAELEFRAQQIGVQVDLGEAQLAAMALHDRVGRLASGDKRAIAGFERLTDQVPALTALAGRVWCFEQIVRRALSEQNVASFRESVCKDREADTAIAICVSCSSPTAPQWNSVVQGLDSYIGAVRDTASTLLAAPSH